MVYMRARYYDPSIGRFCNEDPAKVEFNWFAYANNNPITSVDKTGKETLVEINFTLTINDETFDCSITIDLSRSAVVGALKQMFTSRSGQALAMFMFRRGLGATDSAISLMIKLLNDDGSTDEVWHAVVDLAGEVIHQHIH